MDYRRLSFFLVILIIGTLVPQTFLNEKYGTDKCDRHAQSPTSVRLIQEKTELQELVKELEGDIEEIKGEHSLEIKDLKSENDEMHMEISSLKAEIKKFRNSDMKNKKTGSDLETDLKISALQAKLQICEEAKIYEKKTYENKRNEALKNQVCDEAKICEKVCEESLKRIEIADRRIKTMNSQMMGLVHDVKVGKKSLKIAENELKTVEKAVSAPEISSETIEVEDFPDTDSVEVEPETQIESNDPFTELVKNAPKEPEQEKVQANPESLSPESLRETNMREMSRNLQPDTMSHPKGTKEDTSDHTHAEMYKTEIGKHQPENNKWIILGFASTSYLFSAKMWYHQLSSLGYTEHVIVALDRKVYDELTYNNTLDDHNYYRVLPSGPSNRYLDEPTRHMEGQGYLKSIWSMRLEKVSQLLEEGFNVFVTDIDSIWLKYIPMQQLSREYDVLHTICGTWPPAMYKTWGFVVCAGVAGYRSTEATRYMVKSLAGRCYPACDDQVALNLHTYHHLGHMEWTIPAGTVVNQTERVIPEFENELDPLITGETTKIYKVKAMIFQESTIRRKGVMNCKDAKGSWIVSPQVPKTGNAKIIMYAHYRACLNNGTRIYNDASLKHNFKHNWTVRFG